MTTSPLRPLLAPGSVAVIGASPTAGKAGNALMRSLGTFTGSVYAVHPTATEVLGRRAYPRIEELPETPDLALIVVPAAAVPGVALACGTAGVRGAVVHAGGFSETGDAGAKLQGELSAAAKATGLRVLGPNTSGFVAPSLNLCASFVGSAAGLAPGPLAIVAQSGGVNHALAFAAYGEGLGIRVAVGLGNAVDVGFEEVLDYLRHDPEVGVVALAIEGVQDGRALAEAVERLVDRVPVVALKLGRTDVSEFARSHTGAVTGHWRTTRAALRQAGAVVVDDTTALLDAARALGVARLPPRRRVGVGVVTGQAGPGLLLADALGAAGVALPQLSTEVRSRLEALLGSLTFLGNPVDTGRPGPALREVLRTVGSADGVDVLAVYLLDEPDAVDVRSALPEAGAGPLVLGTAGPPEAVARTRDALAIAGIPVLTTPERTAAAVAALVADAEAGFRRRAAPTASPQRVAERSGGGTSWDEDTAKALVAGLGVATPPRRVCTVHDEALAAADAVGYPVVAKLLHSELRHKTEAGAVRVGLRDRQELAAALHELDKVDAPAGSRYLVEKMAPAGPELLLGAVRDPTFGPLVVLGAGGIEAEIGVEPSIRLAPVSSAEAATMLGELGVGQRFRGHRGAPAVDEEELARVIAAVSAVIAERDDIAELEINPLRVCPGRLVALDALVVAADDPEVPAAAPQLPGEPLSTTRQG